MKWLQACQISRLERRVHIGLLSLKSQGHWDLCGQTAIALGSQSLQAASQMLWCLATRGFRLELDRVVGEMCQPASVESMGQMQMEANRQQGKRASRKRCVRWGQGRDWRGLSEVWGWQWAGSGSSGRKREEDSHQQGREVKLGRRLHRWCHFCSCLCAFPWAPQRSQLSLFRLCRGRSQWTHLTNA